MYATSKELGAIKGISEQKVTKLKEIGAAEAGSWVLLGAGPKPPRGGPLPPPLAPAFLAVVCCSGSLPLPAQSRWHSLPPATHSPQPAPPPPTRRRLQPRR